MKFKLGVVGHRDTVKMVSDLVKEYFDDVEVQTEEFGNDAIITDAVQRITRLQTVCDGILYSRRDPYLLISRRLQHTVPVRYVDVDSSHLLISLLKANIHYGILPTNISIDTFDHASTVEAFRTVGVSEERLTIHVVTADPGQDGLVNTTLAQHLEHYRNGAQLCITNVTDVYRSLLKLNIPATVISPTSESFVHEIRNLMLRYRLKSQDSSSLAVMHINLRYKEKYRYYGEMPIREIEELGNAAKLLSVFAEKVDGAMFSLSRWEYLILCSRLLLQDSTNQFVEIDLMNGINRDTVFDIAMGIGCGQTVKEAQSNAVLASNRTITERGTNTVVALSPEHFIGPISPRSEHLAEGGITETRLEEIAAATGLSTSTVGRLYQAMRKRNSNLFTSAELAETLEVTTRTVNRIIERLTDHQCAAIAGKNLAKPKGRPARVIRLLF
jgi:hypothetical protein